MTRRAQLKRLSSLAKAALGRWGVAIGSVRLITHWENTVYDVRGVDGRRWALRIHREGYQSEASIRGELWWLSSLRQAGEVPVPCAVVGRDGDCLQRVATTGIPEGRWCVLFEWVSGRFQSKRWGAASMGRLGELTARLHHHARGARLPQGCMRPRLDVEGTMGAGSVFGDPLALTELTDGDRALVERVRSGAAQVIESELGGDGGGFFGLIHADLHRWNVLFEASRAKVIDFDDCGLGYFPYDAVVTLRQIEAQPDAQALTQAYFEGYGRVGSLEGWTERVLGALTVMDRVQSLAWVHSRRELEGMVKIIPGVVRKARAVFEAFEDGRPWIRVPV